MKKDIIDKVKDLFKDKTPFEEGNKDAYKILEAMSNDEVMKRYGGKAPTTVPREAQEELFKRFTSNVAKGNCKVCHGRGRAEWMPQLHQYRPCDCLQRVIRQKEEQENTGGLYDPSGNKIKFMN